MYEGFAVKEEKSVHKSCYLLSFEDDHRRNSKREKRNDDAILEMLFRGLNMRLLFDDVSSKYVLCDIHNRQ